MMTRSTSHSGAAIDGVGIDFGTTNSVVAIASRSKPYPRIKALLSEDGPHPSVVWYQGGVEPRVGRIAKTNILGFSEAPGNFFVPSIKRDLGKGKSLTIFNTTYEAKQIASHIFRHLKNDARESHGIEFSEAVVTVPVNFDGRARRDLRSAANDAGIYIKKFVHEPFAAIVGYCFSEKADRSLEDREGQKILVFDWGGQGRSYFRVGDLWTRKSLGRPFR
jgi:molecular chaperone DnaK